MEPKVRASCTWTQTAGNEISKLLPTRISDEDVFVKPDLYDVVNEERSALFLNNQKPCELQIAISPRFKIAAFTLVCSVPKVELFLGPSQEYYQTIYGECMEEDDDEVPIRPYRYDVEIDRSGIADINLKLLSSSEEICIYGAMLHIAPNPNGITTQLVNPNNLKMTQELLQCGTADNCGPKFQQFMALMQRQGETIQNETKTNADKEMSMSSLYLDICAKLDQLESKISKRLDDFEAQQAQKLDKIIAILEKKH
ncbi:uncharacterized protein LOC115621252 [Scaptodrosophila lebanonensis]|uniref:Uncharacterized protein LOC115621252 n=1 Tax=Drosophila lebanonensis TaxID=7225 RepID=A0A6J2T1C6_DROLE|nr:uncharacterized protein LOC115621252 [Scaptodrosophila lebanonensis]